MPVPAPGPTSLSEHATLNFPSSQHDDFTVNKGKYPRSPMSRFVFPISLPKKSCLEMPGTCRDPSIPNRGRTSSTETIRPHSTQIKSTKADRAPKSSNKLSNAISSEHNTAKRQRTDRPSQSLLHVAFVDEFGEPDEGLATADTILDEIVDQYINAQNSPVPLSPFAVEGCPTEQEDLSVTSTSELRTGHKYTPSGRVSRLLVSTDFEASVKVHDRHLEIWDIDDEFLCVYPAQLHLICPNMNLFDSRSVPNITRIDIRCFNLSPPVHCHCTYDVEFNGQTPSNSAPDHGISLDSEWSWVIYSHKSWGWFANFSVPMPASLFHNAETRLFRIETRIWMGDMANPQPLEAVTEVSVSHLRRWRQMDSRM